MAVARPVRLLGSLSIVLFFFVVYQLLKEPPRLTPGSEWGGTINDMRRDPLLDRMAILCSATAAMY